MKTRLIGVIMSFLVVLAIYVLINSTPFGVAQLRQFSLGEGLVENWFWYTPDQVRHLLEAWGASGRNWYVGVLFWIGLALVLSYVFFLALFFLYLLKRINPHWTGWYLSPWLAFATGGFDFLHSLHIVVFALFLPNFDLFYWTGAFFAVGRWVLFGLCAAWATILVIWHASQRVRRVFKRTNPPMG